MHLRQWWKDRQQAHRDQLIQRHWIPDLLWQQMLDRYPFLSYRPAAQMQRLRELSALFLATKEFTTTEDMALTDEMAVAVAVQACVPILGLKGDLAWYARFIGIVLQPDEVVAHRIWVDETTGVVHESDEWLTGEAMLDGPVMLSWPDVWHAHTSAKEGYNVVIHELVHVIDMHDGQADGIPQLPDITQRARWRVVLDQARQALQSRLEAGQATFLDPYACTGPEEFFTVASEAFFVAPHALRQEQPAFYALLSRFYDQEPHRFAPAEATNATIRPLVCP
jgi:Mlc titration factor MtfA (ptsG expression regulator)